MMVGSCQVAFATGLRRPSGSTLPPFDVTFTGGALGKRPGVEPHPFVTRMCADLDSANPTPQPSAEQQFWAEMQHAEVELASGASAVLRLESALARLEQRLPSHLLGQLQLALGLSCAAEAKHDDAHRWFERCARELSARGPDPSSTTTFVPVFNQALQLAALGRCDPPSPPLAFLPSPSRPRLPSPSLEPGLTERGTAQLPRGILSSGTGGAAARGDGSWHAAPCAACAASAALAGTSGVCARRRGQRGARGGARGGA